MMAQLKSRMSVVAIGLALPSVLMALPSLAQSKNADSTNPIVPASPTASKSATFSKNKCSLIDKVSSKPMPLPGQSHRSSQNFNLSSIRIGQVFKVEAKPGVSFDLKKDRRLAPDPILTSRMKAGYYKRVSGSPLYPVYIADPSEAGKSDFVVKFCK